MQVCHTKNYIGDLFLFMFFTKLEGGTNIRITIKSYENRKKRILHVYWITATIVTVLHKQQWRIKGRGHFPPKIVKLKLNHTPSGKEKEQLVCLSNIIFFFLETRGLLLHKSDFNCTCVVWRKTPFGYALLGFKCDHSIPLWVIGYTS